MKWISLEAAKKSGSGSAGAEEAGPDRRWGASFTALSDSKARTCTPPAVSPPLLSLPTIHGCHGSARHDTTDHCMPPLSWMCREQ
jgi:hypothetical protein